MSHLRAWCLRFAGLFDKERRDRDLADELQSHLQLHIEENVRSGMGAAEARRQALIQLGGLEPTKERYRERRGVLWLESVLQDVRFGARLLRKSPGFTIVAVLTLALGIGANSAIFSIVNGVILRPLQYPKPEQLMRLTSQFPGLGLMQFWVSVPEYFEFREINRSFSEVGAYTTGEVNLSARDQPLRVRSASVDEHLLNALGVQPLQGRLFDKGETDATGPPPLLGQPEPLPLPIAILSYELWQTAFGGRSIVGQTVEVNGRPREIIGIMAPGTDVMDNRTQIWLPLGLNPANRQARANHFLYLIGRLKDGVNAQSAQSELTALIENWGERIGIKPGTAGVAGHVFIPLAKGADSHILQMKPMQDDILGAVGRTIWVLQVAVGIVLLIACANLANLLLARAETRQRELAVRIALGAGRGQLFRQFMTEGVLLSILGGALGLWLAHIGLQALIRAYSVSLPRISEIAIDPLVLLFTSAVSVGTGMVFGLVPFLHTHTKGLATSLKDGGIKGATAASPDYIRRGLVAAEVALAVVLVVGMGLLVRTVYNLNHVDVGFNRSHLVTFSTTLPPATYRQPSARAQLYQGVLDKLRAIPGVQAATAMSDLPLNRRAIAQSMDIGNFTPFAGGPAESVDYVQSVMSDYFETMGIPIVQGRSFQRIDAGSPGIVAVVNQTLVNTFWKGQKPIGQQLRLCCFPGAATSSDQVPWFRVIGVAQDVKQGSVNQRTGAELYLFVDQMADVRPPMALAPGTMNVVLRTTLSPGTLLSTIEHVIREVDRTVPIVRLRDMDSVFAESIQRPRFLAQLLASFACLALVLAAIGTYGVLSYIVSARRREIGVRMAVGAQRSVILKTVIAGGMKTALVGTAIGITVALALTRFLSSLLFGVTPTDPATFVAVTLVLLGVALLACYIPARRATRVDPMVALRYE